MELPLELLKEIALKTPSAYHVLVRTTKLITFDKHLMMQLFTTLRLGKKGGMFNKIIGYRLPNDDLHIIDEITPSIVVYGDQYWYYQGKLHRGSRSVIETNLAGTRSVIETNLAGTRSVRSTDLANDLPAVIYSDGTQAWYCHGKRHREKYLPAVVDSNGYQAWYYHGSLHRDNGLPAVIYSDGTQEWYCYGQLHRDSQSASGNDLANDLPAVIYSNGTQEWYYKGKRHRCNDLPAVINSDGSQEWYYKGKRHRCNDLPAVVYSNDVQEWYRHDVKYTLGADTISEHL